ncbi:AAA family ATPase [Candidatus Methylobacter oryzae]|uniref:AAA family ATPase n=1 Tax=Candidatus Methylobacter oryzae TaxID=2497749 RepID=A0ABY3C8F2_9GAMM|nr:AAA family ATPase [Candidatus Methylobacter oryzae]TRW92888.1 AAA family ATPase [Candidatus Methylobacter oryzae]
MLKRLYVHNYKCLVNFEINFDKDISLFLGANGSGKSTVFEVLTKLRRVIIDEEKIENVFNKYHITRWLDESERKNVNIHFELDIEIGESIYKYKLVLWHLYVISDDIMMSEESLYHNNKMLIESKDGKTSVISFKENEELLLDITRSGINRYLSFYAKEFLQYLRTLLVVRINPYEMASSISKANAEVKTDFSNYAEWFSHLNEKNRRGVSEFEKAMRDIIPGFDYFRIDQAGQAKVLQVDFENNGIITYYFNELSEGQKVLIALYSVIYCAPESSLICIDEPENFLALPEIQPWLNALREQCRERNMQVLLISHHPSLINFLAAGSGYWFSRQDNHTRIEKITEQDNDGLSLAQLIEIGWIYGD